ncbi:MAG: HAMP domain-containing sensor histidine kinase [Tissierellaceae bacterium]|nr:HAMP domain-containing sensor histidine kinase [Tissierellaceae bacterium]
MKSNRMKKSIYIRMFSVFLATYLLLMVGFSVFLVSKEKKTVDRELALHSTQISNRVVENLQGHLDSNNQIADIYKIKKNFVNKPIYVGIFDVPEVALFTSDYELLYNTNDYWRCAYNVIDGNTHSIRYGLLNPKDWFSEEEIKELENYIYTNPKAKKIGDLDGYLLSIYGLWMDNEVLIPDKIVVSPMYATDFDENRKVVSSSADRKDNRVYSSNYRNMRNLPYFEHGGIMQEYNVQNNENRDEIRQMVTEQSKLNKSVQEILESTTSRERVNSLIYRYYMIVPYQNSVTILGENSFHSDFWTAVGLDINIGERISSTLLYVWISCLFIFIIAAYILSRQSYKTYLIGAQLEKQRKEMTDALAHDLKTPLSIISGYAQNLQENIHTEKRNDYANHINENVGRMDKIIRQMLEMSRIESDSLDLKLIDISLAEISNEIINRYKQVCDDKHISITIEGNADVKADNSLIERVIDNFMVNAIDNTPEDGRINIKISSKKFEIYNSGSHIPEDKIKEIWLPYKKGNVERDNTRGTGLGLAISRTIFELHKFSYGANNDDDGVTFWFKWV